jgi:uncharacterized protein (UPF0335 family)
MTDISEVTRDEILLQEAFTSTDASLIKNDALGAYILRVEREIEESNTELMDVLNQIY